MRTLKLEIFFLCQAAEEVTAARLRSFPWCLTLHVHLPFNDCNTLWTPPDSFPSRSTSTQTTAAEVSGSANLEAVKSVLKRDKTRTGARGLFQLVFISYGVEQSTLHRGECLNLACDVTRWRFLSLVEPVWSGLLLDEEVAQDHSLSSRQQQPGSPTEATPGEREINPSAVLQFNYCCKAWFVLASFLPLGLVHFTVPAGWGSASSLALELVLSACCLTVSHLPPAQLLVSFLHHSPVQSGWKEQAN